MSDAITNNGCLEINTEIKTTLETRREFQCPVTPENIGPRRVCNNIQKVFSGNGKANAERSKVLIRLDFSSNSLRNARTCQTSSPIAVVPRTTGDVAVAVPKKGLQSLLTSSPWCWIVSVLSEGFVSRTWNPLEKHCDLSF